VNVADFVTRKLTALQCHRTQMGDDSHPFAHVGEADARRLLGVEYFHRADIPSARVSLLEQL
jgi:hypothetical protein